MHELELGKVLATDHRGHDDLLSAGLGLTGLAGLPVPFVNPLAPTAAELRRRAIQTSWKGIADLGPLGGYGSVYGGVPNVPGREYQMFAQLPGARSPHRVLLQLPDNFDHAKRCLVVTASSGSRGIYGAIAVAGAWGLPRGCAVAYTDKGTGSGYFDYADDSGVALDGRRAKRGEQALEFEPPPAAAGAGIAVKHAHSGDNPEADWGRDVIQAAQFGLAMLDRAYPGEAPFTAQNTKIIATGISNGGGAVLQAAGLDHDGFFAGVVALEPNVYAAACGRSLYDYATEAAIWLPCALADARFDDTLMARGATRQPPPAWSLRCASLRAQGKLPGNTLAEQSAQAHHYLQQRGWNDAAMATAASTTAFDLWRVVTAGYASAYLRRGPADMPCGFHYAPTGVGVLPGVTDPVARAAWWADASGIPPGNGVGLFGGEGFIMQRLEGDGWVFVQMGGALVERELAAGEELHIDTGCLAAYTPGVDFDLVMAGGVKSMLFGGEGLFFARLRGPGKVWIQSLPFARLAGRMLQAAQGGGQNRGEGSILGGLGNLIDGN